MLLSWFENIWILTPNDPKYPQFWSQVASRTFLRSKWARASILCIIFPGSETLIFWPRSTPNTPNLGSGDLDWSRKPLCRNHQTKSSVLIYSLSWCENLWNLTRNPLNFRSGDLGWPWKPPFGNQRTKSCIFVYNLSRFEDFCILTPNDPNFFCDLIPFHYQNGL